ncbi:hypothetical protein SAMN02745217_00331 [Anaerocolumna xylanovorans DSM 12503]|uniref:ATP synthase I chain n=1 Tax=Anaerocolumna xylanovorans DSM 12503 TaxID=1121345 RepID=A0A1M7XXM8_9FIRM|nr:hypothetical protein SAMN02745217_00331 [Anaerocolumna xylanovorans DSM 12503]
MIPQAKIKQEIESTSFCVAGLSFLLIAFYLFADKFSLSVVLGTVIGSAASIGNFILNIYTAKYSAKYDQKKAAHIVLLSKIIRSFLMGIIVYFILMVPMVHNITGIIALFFPQISRGIIYIIKS